jgi:hypothetical protein
MSMAKYKIPMETTVSSWVTVEADTFEAAVEGAYMEGVPGLMHLDHTYPDVGEWEVPEWFITENEEKSN